MRSLIAVGIIMLVAGACGGDAEPATTITVVAPVDSTTQAPATTTSSAATTTVPETTTTAAPTTTTTSTTTTTTTTLPPTVCPVPVAFADGTLVFSGAFGDFDGDGNVDELMTYQVGPDQWRVRVVFADGGGADAAIAEGLDFAPPRPIGGYDIDGDGPQEAFLTVGSGASTVQVGFFDVTDCVATRVTSGGLAAVFGVGGSVGTVSGIFCPGDGTIHRIFASYVADNEYEGGFEPFALSGSVLTGGFGDGAGFTADEAFALAILDCGSLALP
jgi:hypothetical protein